MTTDSNPKLANPTEYHIRFHPDRILRQISTPVDALTDDVTAQLAAMDDIRIAEEGIGIAAVQVGLLKRMAIIDIPEGEQQEALRVVMINPQIISDSDEISTSEEGCLSIPDQRGKVSRAHAIRVSFRDEKFAQHEIELEGLAAVCVQHEIDHMDGILFFDHMSKLSRDLLLKRYTKQRLTQDRETE